MLGVAYETKRNVACGQFLGCGGAVFYLIQRSMQFLVVVDVYKYVLYVEVRYLLQHMVQQTGSDWDIRQGCMSFIFTCHPFAN